MTAREFKDRVSRRAKRAGAVADAAILEGLWIYYQLLSKWNQKINLTGLDLTDPTPQALDRLLVEPLVAARHTNGATSLIDIGSGGGSPALPLALAVPGAKLTMVEVKTRKSVFLREAIRELGLDGSTVVTARYETLLSNPALHEAFDLLTIRAVRVESRVFSGLQALVASKGRIFHFRTVGEASQPLLPPPLVEIATIQLSETLKSQLAVIGKRES